MNKAYDKITWQNTPSTATPLGATNLNKMSDALDTIDDRVIDLDENKSSVSISGTLESGDTIANITIDGTTTPIKSTQITVDSQLSPTSENPVQNKVITNAFVETASHVDDIDEKKADKNGEITSAKASYSLLCDTPINDVAPYTYRQFPATNAKLEKLKKLIGASVVWNQILNNFTNRSETLGITITVNNDGSITVIGTATSTNNLYFKSGITFKKDHIYLLRGSKSNTANHGLLVVNYNFKDTGNGVVFKMGVDTNNGQIGYFFTQGDVLDERVYPQLTDLTEMFGTTIADYVNTLETAQAGSGIAWLKKYGFFTEDYYAYSANTIQSVSVSGHKVVGKNLAEITNTGTITANGITWTVNPDGTVTANGTATATAIFFLKQSQDFGKDLQPNTEYIMSSGYGNNNVWFGLYYNDSTIWGVSVTNNGERKFTTISDFNYVRFGIRIGNGTTVNNVTFKPMVRLSTISDSTFEPYHTETTALDHTTLRGLFKLDANNNLYADGDIYNADGSEDVKYEERAYASGDESLPDTITDGTTTVTKKATPTTAALTPFNPLSTIEQGGTEEFVDYGVSQGNRDVAIPCGTDTDFYQGLSLPALPTSGGKVELTYDPTNGVFSWE